jgi:hypothetical protein
MRESPVLEMKGLYLTVARPCGNVYSAMLISYDRRRLSIEKSKNERH